MLANGGAFTPRGASRCCWVLLAKRQGAVVEQGRASEPAETATLFTSGPTKATFARIEVNLPYEKRTSTRLVRGGIRSASSRCKNKTNKANMANKAKRSNDAIGANGASWRKGPNGATGANEGDWANEAKGANEANGMSGEHGGQG